MQADKHEFELTIAYECAERGWLTATVPALPGAISAGRTRDEARSNVLDAVRTMLSTPPEGAREGDVEVVRVRLERSRGHDLGLGL
jgi:predicted RNase H-like HicB family nuclease